MPIANIETLIDMLAYRAEQSPDRTALTFAGQPCTFVELWQRVNQFGGYLQQAGVQPGDRVVLVLPNSHEFFFAFYGVQRTGAIAVPVFPGFGPAHILSIASLCGARVIVIPSTTPQAQLAHFKQQGAEHHLTIVTVAGSAGHTPSADFPPIDPADVAFIQYTSGSTGNPKGVMLSHQNLITNMRQMIAGMEITETEIFVSWLPVYHDMGLILKTMVPFYLAASVILLPTSLKHIHHWLAAIQQHRATFTAAPDFAYRLCLRHIKNPRAYDLSSLRVALNAAEPVRVQTIRDFERTFDLKNVMVAGYGLAEATVGVSMGRPQTQVAVDGQGQVSVGHPFPEIEITIVRDGQPVEPGEVGEIIVSSPANSTGYYNNAEATRQLFWQPGIIHTGDLGYLNANGELFIVGRKKNIIIHAGRTVYPQDVEEMVDSLPGVRYSAAVGIDRDRLEGEQVYVFAEVRQADDRLETELQGMVIDIVQMFHDRFGFRPGRVYLVKPKAIPLTHNGKIQHVRLKESYLNRTLLEAGQVVYPNY